MYGAMQFDRICCAGLLQWYTILPGQLRERNAGRLLKHMTVVTRNAMMIPPGGM